MNNRRTRVAILINWVSFSLKQCFLSNYTHLYVTNIQYIMPRRCQLERMRLAGMRAGFQTNFSLSTIPYFIRVTMLVQIYKAWINIRKSGYIGPPWRIPLFYVELKVLIKFTKRCHNISIFVYYVRSYKPKIYTMLFPLRKSI